MTLSATPSIPEPSASLRPLSDMLAGLRESLPRRNGLTVGTLVEALHERGTGAVMALFALLVMIPIPGLNTLFAAPLVLLTARQALGHRTVWLPRRLMDRTLDSGDMAGAISRILPVLRKVEMILRPRLARVTAGTERLFGALGVIMSLFASIPIPLTHTVPGFGLLLMAIGMTQRDGLAVLAGAVIGTGYIILVTGAIAVFGPHAAEAIHHMLKPS